MLNEGIKWLNSLTDKEFYSDFDSVIVLLHCLYPESGMRLCNTALIGQSSVNGLLNACLYNRIFSYMKHSVGETNSVSLNIHNHTQLTCKYFYLYGN